MRCGIGVYIHFLISSEEEEGFIFLSLFFYKVFLVCKGWDSLSLFFFFALLRSLSEYVCVELILLGGRSSSL